MSGRYGSVKLGPTGAPTVISTVEQWQVSVLSDLKTFVASNTHGGTGRRPGINDWNGSFMQYGGIPAAMPGDLVDFIGCAGPVPPAALIVAGPSQSGPAIISELTTNWDWLGNECVKMSTSIVGAGPLVSGTVAGQDTSAPIVSPSSLCHFIITPVSRGGVVSPSVVPYNPCLRAASLKVTAGQKDYLNSCSVGGWKSRRAGILDWELSMVMEEADLLQVPYIPGDIVLVKCPVDATDFWQLTWGIVQEFSNYIVNIATGDLIGYTVTIKMGIDDGLGGANPPVVSKPGGGGTVTWWPKTTSALAEEPEREPILS
jgi:hypothetical protein